MYVDKLEERTRHDTTPISPTDEVFSLESYGRIMNSEVKEALRASKKGSAAGPDGLLLRDVKKVSPFLLCNIFNKWYLHRIPVVENRCRTILLYKSGDRHLASNYRPVTIGNMLNRLYSKIWERRIRKNLSHHVRQKAFIPVDGCFENVKTIQHILRSNK